MKFKEYKIEEFIYDLSSESPSPGGGSVAALVASLAASLNSMVYSLTVNKKKFAEVDLDTKKLVLDFKEASDKFSKRAINLMEEDRDAFNKLMDCYKLPKSTEEEIKFRNNEIDKKTLGALKAPYDITKECYSFYDNIDIAVKYGNKMLLSDAACAAILLDAAIESAIVNVRINLASLKNKEYVEKLENELQEIEKNSKQRKNDINEAIKAR